MNTKSKSSVSHILGLMQHTPATRALWYLPCVGCGSTSRVLWHHQRCFLLVIFIHSSPRAGYFRVLHSFRFLGYDGFALHLHERMPKHTIHMTACPEIGCIFRFLATITLRLYFGEEHALCGVQYCATLDAEQGGVLCNPLGWQAGGLLCAAW